MYLSQVLNGLLLPAVLVFMLLLINKSGLMGDFRNRLPHNLIAGGTVVVLVILTFLLAPGTVFPHLFGP